MSRRARQRFTIVANSNRKPKATSIASTGCINDSLGATIGRHRRLQARRLARSASRRRIMIVITANWTVVSARLIEVGKQVVWRGAVDLIDLSLRRGRGVGQPGWVRDSVGVGLARGLDPEPIAVLREDLRRHDIVRVVIQSNTNVVVEFPIALDHEFAGLGSRSSQKNLTVGRGIVSCRSIEVIQI